MPKNLQQASREQEWKPRFSPWLIAFSVMLATFMEVLDTSIASVTLPHIAGSLSASTSEATWVLTTYLVANAVVLPSSSWFSLRFGRKSFLLLCIIVFTISSFLCGAATSLSWILIARTVQGASGGALQPLSQAILLESFPPEKRGAAMAIFALGVVVAPVLGPTLGGWLTDQYSWRWAFYINVPVGLVAVLLISRFVEDPPYISAAKPGRIDAIGLGLLAVWLGALQIILDKGQEDDWFGALWIRWAVAIVIAGFIAFLVRQLVIRNPIVNLCVFKDRNFSFGCLLIALLGSVVYGLVTILPLFYQTLMNYTASAAGIAVSPRGLGAIIIMPVAAALSSRMDNRWLIAIGYSIIGVTAMWMGGLTLDISQWSLTWPIIISGIGTGLVFVTLSTLAMGTLPKEQIGNASGLYNLFRNIGGSIGISIVNTIVARHSQLHRSELSHNLNGGIWFQKTFSHIHTLMSVHALSTLSTRRAFGVIQQTLDQQATVYSYVDDLRYVALLCFLSAPIVFFVKRVQIQPGAAGGH
ncbi:MAG TPA: DHA2 family efflux MFS transporter permease subunit [Candidatus Acidoferrum sp.]